MAVNFKLIFEIFNVRPIKVGAMTLDSTKIIKIKNMHYFSLNSEKCQFNLKNSPWN